MQGKLRLDGNTDAAFVLHAPCWTHTAVREKKNVCWGDPREEVCDAVEELHLESLVMASRAWPRPDPKVRYARGPL